MKTLLLNLLIVFNLSALSQTQLPDNFKIGNYVEVFNKDSIKIYFNCTGSVVEKRCAVYYRVGKMDTEIINVVGDFQDYTSNGKLYLKGTMINNGLEGKAIYFYENGKLKEEGNYKKNIRDGKWIFYYPNGQIQKIYYYKDGIPDILEAYNPNGKATVVNGQGKFKTQVSRYKECDKYEIQGQLLNGKRNGTWTFSNIKAFPLATEFFEEGKFIQGKSGTKEYMEDPKIDFSDFYANENLDLIESHFGCQGDYNFWPIKYDNQLFETSFYKQLQEKLSNYTGLAKNQWLVVGISLSNKDEISTINVASSIDDEVLEKHIYNSIEQLKSWQTAIINKRKITSDIFFTVLVDNNQLIILADYIRR